MKINLILFLFLLLSILVSSASGQSKEGSELTIIGHVRDSLTGKEVVGATITIFNPADDHIEQFGFTNKQGRFVFKVKKQIPSFGFRISHLEYEGKERVLKRTGKSTLTLETFQLTQKTNTLEQVVIRPPMMLKNDTLEIYPEAFDLGENTVVEDLLNKVPGVIVWGDGKITINGIDVSKVLVDGEPFFGGETVVATRNLPNSVVDKVKVYDTKAEQDAEKKTKEVDIILKEDKKAGVFGKATLGVGNKKLKEGLGVINLYNQKNQLSVFSARNNTNKEAYNVRDFLKTTIYKPGGEDFRSFAPQFGLSGRNDFFNVGGRFDRKWNDTIRSSFESLLYDKENNTKIWRKELREVENSQQRIDQSTDENRLTRVFTARIESPIPINGQQLEGWLNFQRKQNNYTRQSNRILYNEQGDLLSTLDNKTIEDIDEYNMRSNFQYRLPSRRSLFDKVAITYKGHIGRSTNDLHLKDALQRKGENLWESTDRQKHSTQNHIDNEVSSSFNIKDWLAIKDRQWEFVLHNDSKHNRQKGSQEYNIIDPINGTKSNYIDLTFVENYNHAESNTTFKSFYNRTKKDKGGFRQFRANFTLGHQFLSQKNQSFNNLRAITLRKQFILPSAEIGYSQRTGTKSLVTGVKYYTSIRAASLEEMVGIRDTLEKVYMLVGNRNLTPEYIHTIVGHYNFENYRKNDFHKFKLTYDYIKDPLISANTYTSNGGIEASKINGNIGQSAITFDYNYVGYKNLWKKPLGITSNSSASYRPYMYINNGKVDWIKSAGYSLFIHGNYKVSDRFLLEMQTTSRLNSTKDNNKNKFYMWYNDLGTNAVFSFPKRITLINSLAAIHQKIGKMDNYNIIAWDFHVYYRMMKKEQLEFKLSLNDILRQRRNNQTIIMNNISVDEQRNNLNQFFLLSISYYPRFF